MNNIYYSSLLCRGDSSCVEVTPALGYFLNDFISRRFQQTFFPKSFQRRGGHSQWKLKQQKRKLKVVYLFFAGFFMWSPHETFFLPVFLCNPSIKRCPHPVPLHKTKGRIARMVKHVNRRMLKHTNRIKQEKLRSKCWSIWTREMKK